MKLVLSRNRCTSGTSYTNRTDVPVDVDVSVDVVSVGLNVPVELDQWNLMYQ